MVIHKGREVVNGKIVAQIVVQIQAGVFLLRECVYACVSQPDSVTRCKNDWIQCTHLPYVFI